jgi:histone H3/H4
MLRHREAWAEEQKSPTEREWADEQAREQQEAERAKAQADQTPITHAVTKEPRMSNEVPEVTKEVLVVVSKVKSYIRASSGMNTSDAVTEALSELVRNAADQAVAKAKSDGRKTVMARDIPGATVTD